MELAPRGRIHKHIRVKQYFKNDSIWVFFVFDENVIVTHVWVKYTDRKTYSPPYEH